MCLYPRFYKNRKYEKNKKNGGVIPAINDSRVLYVPVPCENCMECRKKKAREWQIRLQEDIKTNTDARFITFTLSNESIKELHQVLMQNPENWGLENFDLDNAIIKLALRRFNENYRRKFGKALRHWTVTELGHEGTENIHLHGIIWTPKRVVVKRGKGRGSKLIEVDAMDEIERLWGYGYVWKYKMVKGRPVNYVNNRTVNYITKYVSKRDDLYKHYKSKVLCSPGIGKGYTDSHDVKRNQFKPKGTNQTYKTESGHRVGLPKYWKNKIYSDDEKEELWLQALDRKEQWVCGIKVSTKNGNQELFKLIEEYRKKSNRLGYGNYLKDLEREQWEKMRRGKMQRARLEKARS
ncbi:MAG: replication initiator protein [Microviridae sp.]|nr:MAG: replication initiator protein [Microviridae sp.]